MKKCATVAAAGTWMALLVAGCGGSPTAPTPAALPPGSTETSLRTPPPLQLAIDGVMAFGDSITEGFVSPLPGVLEVLQPTNAYPVKLEQFLRERFPDEPIAVANRGRGGEHVADGLSRFLTDLGSLRPDLVLLLEGINDLSYALLVARIEERQLDPAVITKIVSDLRGLVRSAQVRDAEVFIATLTPVTDVYEAQNPGARAAIRSINTRIRTMAASVGAVVVDLHTTLSGGSMFIGMDGLHPTKLGYETIARTFLNEIVDRYESLGAVPPDVRVHGAGAEPAQAAPGVSGSSFGRHEQIRPLIVGR